MRLRFISVAASAGLLAIGATVSFGGLKSLFSVDYLPHRFCYLAQPVLIWTNVLTDILIAVSYVAIFSALAWAVGKLRRLPELRPYLWIFASFGAFILACGVTHFMEVITVWWPAYRLSAALKVVCALVSIPTAVFFVWKVPGLVQSIRGILDLIANEQHTSEQLRKSQEFLDRTGRIAGIGGWVVDLQSNEVTWSTETYHIHGMPLEYVPTLEQGLDFYTAESKPIITAAVEHACATGEGWDLELCVTRADGHQIWVRTCGTAEFRDFTPIRLVGAFQDITDRVAERNKLKEANERIALATDSGSIGIWDWDLAENTIRGDAWMHRLHGYEYLGGADPEARWAEHFHPDDAAMVMQAIQDAIDDVRPYELEFRVVWPDQSVHIMQVTGKVTRDASGRALRMVGTNCEVTEARRLTAEVARHHELMRVTLKSIADGVITTDADCNVVWLNPVAERMTGWSNAEAVGRPLTEVFCILNYVTRLPVENPVMTCLAKGEPGKLAPDTILISRDGSRFGIDDSAAPIRGERGELLGAVLVFHDVTEQRRLFYETTRVAKVELKLKDDFLSRVSHELRSPLTSIYSFSSIIADGLAGETTPEQQEYLGIVLKNVGQLRAMIEDLLTVTQVNEGKLSIEPQRVTVSETVVDALHTIQGPAARKQIAVSSSFADGLPAAYADPTRMLQILIILLDNAVKFTPVGGRIGVRVSENGTGLLLIEVSDTGCGVPPEKRMRVFENLYQITGQDQRDTGQNGRNGLGLGLHIARDLVTRQGGQIWISSAPSQGSIFSFTLPAFAEGAELIEQEPTLSDSENGFESEGALLV